jgi:hypothetical protein
MKYDEIVEEIKKDFSFDKKDIGNETSKTLNLFQKYIRMWAEENKYAKKLELDKKKLEQIKRDYYSGNAPAEVYKDKPFGKFVKTDSGIQRYIECDDDMLRIEEALSIQKQKIMIIEAALDERKSRSWDIKNAIENMKFLNGA